jgi:hypothetical protein
VHQCLQMPEEVRALGATYLNAPGAHVTVQLLGLADVTVTLSTLLGTAAAAAHPRAEGEA